MTVISSMVFLYKNSFQRLKPVFGEWIHWNYFSISFWSLVRQVLLTQQNVNYLRQRNKVLIYLNTT